ncbi:MAG: PQQ-binding-like beta-propeller repeat protein, partial [Planctomycetaceae bacterium]
MSGERLFVPGGRSLPAVFDRQTGELLHFQFGGKSSGGYGVTVGERFYSVAEEQFRHEDGTKIGSYAAAIVDGDTIIEAQRDRGAIEIRRFGEKVTQKKSVDRRGRPVTTATLETDARYELTVPELPQRLFLKAGDRVYGASAGRIIAYDVGDLPARGRDERRPVWSADVEGEVWTMLAADDRLFVVTTEGRIHCFGEQSRGVPPRSGPIRPGSDHNEPRSGAARPGSEGEEIVKTTGITEGYAVVLGLTDGRLVEDLARRTRLHVIAVEADAETVDRIRRRLDDAGLYGPRVVCHVGDPLEFSFPPYLANLIVSRAYGPRSAEAVRQVFHALRPYGGVACLPVPQDQHDAVAQAVREAKLPKAEVRREAEFTLIQRVGALPGSAPWTAQYGDASNSVVSQDQLVKAPLGLLW